MEEEVWYRADISFKAYRQPLEMVSLLRYMGQRLGVVDNYWTAVITNLCKHRKVRACLSWLLWGGDERTSGIFCVVVIQATLIFGLETCFVTPHMAQTLGGFRYRVARRLKA